ncbi:MAG TPA: hypothetical protein VNX28_10920 [Gemmataceae bacterium]|jgi:hypothetical protein|nr:hypothetical protein [Gemmataceae bacterium]
MHTVFCGAASLAVAGIFYSWRMYQELMTQKRRTLRERVTYMLWVMANALPD